MEKLTVNLKAKSARLKRIKDYCIDEIKLKHEDGHSIVSIMIVTGELDDAKDAREVANSICLELGLTLVDKPNKEITEYTFKIPIVPNLTTE